MLPLLASQCHTIHRQPHLMWNPLMSFGLGIVYAATYRHLADVERWGGACPDVERWGGARPAA